MNIVPKLNLNKHPKDCDNLSLVDARNIKISHDESCITNENSIITNDLIQTAIHNIYHNNNFLIRGVIPINTGIVLFVQDYNKVETNINKLDIFVYNEKTIDKDENIYLAYSGLSYHGGKFTGTFTYNVENDLIIAFSEYDCDNNELVPLRTINLGSPDKAGAEDNGDLKQIESKLSIIPEVKLPNISNVEYVKGNAYKGWYYLFIRYKINKTDYTQWYPIGYPIYIDTINRSNIVRYIFNREAFPEKPNETIKLNPLMTLLIGRQPWDGYGVGFSDYISDTTDVCNETFKIGIKDLDINYNIFQIGIICASKSYIKSYKTFDINIVKYIINYYTLNLKDCEEYGSQELISTYYNYFNVKNIINYKNRLYIAGYNENKINEEEIINSVKNITVGLYTSIINTVTSENSNIRRDVTVYKENPNPYQFDESAYPTNGTIKIPFSKYFSCDDTDLVDFLDSENKRINITSIKASDLYISTTNEDNVIDTDRTTGYFAIININYKGTDYSKNKIYRIVINDDMSNIKVINNMKIALQLGLPYIKTDKNFINRKLNTTLIPGEVYNFFIHFVDKYGNFTNGYRIDNTFPKHVNRRGNKVDGVVFIIPGSQIEFEHDRLEYIYCSVDKTAKINDIIIDTMLTSGYILNDYKNPADHMIRYYADYNFITKELDREIQNQIRKEDYEYVKSEIINYAKPFINQNLNYEFYKIFTFNNYVHSSKYGFDNYINSNGDSLFKVPFNNIDVSGHRVYCPYFNNIIIPNGYIGYFISYEKFEKRSKYTGLLTINDFRNTDTIIAKKNIDYTDYQLTSTTISEGINSHSTVKLYSGIIYNVKIVNNKITGGNLSYGIIENGGGSISGIIIDGLINSSTTIDGDYNELEIINGNLRIYRRADNVVKKDSLNTMGSNTMNFYCDSLDIDDTLELDFDFIRIEGKNVFDHDDIPNINYYYQRNAPFGFVTDMNKVQLQGYNFEKLYPMPNYKLAVANSVKDNRLGVGTCIVIDNKYDLFVNGTENKDNDINLYRVSLVKDNPNIYNNNNKTLIKFTDVFYNKNDTGIISTGLNGVYSYSGTIIYADTGVVFNETNGIITMQNAEYQYYPTTISPNSYKTYENDRPFMCYLQMPVVDTVFHESKCFKNEPKPQSYVTKPASKNDSAQYRTGYMVTPANSIDLFENRQGSADQFNPKTYSNYREDIKYIDIYNKTIRRSNIIQDESRENAWRKFDLEAYKNITENKGIITNLVGIGNLVLTHTEHSLFIFDLNNELKTIDQNIQLYQPDAFDVAYKEVFSSELGYGGLQDKRSAIVDQFGYIFYNNDDNNIYRFDNNQLAIISNDIAEWLVKAKPNNVRFAHDIRNNRLLIKFDYDIFRKNEDNSIFTQKCNLVLSYNYKTQNFISKHSYYFRDAYNSKNKVYFINSFKSNNSIYDAVYNFTENINNYCTYDNNYGYSSANEGYNNMCKLSFIVNEGYDIIKFLEYITYKLYKIDESVNGNVPSPVKTLDTPYAGQWLRVYNDNVNTNDINITVDNESINPNEHKNIFGNYKKPYWDLGNWNFSYLRNMIGNEYGQSATVMSRLYGNYFIVEFEFLMQDRRIDFESLSYKISKL